MHAYPQLRPIDFGILLFFVGMSVLYTVCYRLEDLYLYEDRLVIKTLLGKKKREIYLEDIQTWHVDYTQIKVKHGIHLSCELILLSDSFVYKIESGSYLGYSNFAAIRDYLTNGKSFSARKAKRPYFQLQHFFSIGYFITFVILMLSFGSVKQNTIFPGQKLITIIGRINNKPEIRHSKSVSCLHIKLEDYPDFEFGVYFHSTQLEERFVAIAGRGDTVSIYVTAEEYFKKIEKTRQLDFFEKIIDYDFIPAYGLKYENTVYTAPKYLIP